MKVYTEISTLPSFNKAVVTIGTFDGVHLGHSKIIDQLKQEADHIHGETVIITFHPHPRKIVGIDKPTIYLINTLKEKIALLEKAGIHHLVIIPFTEAFANLSASEYVEDFLIKYFHPHTLIIGYDHRFGKGRLGDFNLLEDYSRNLQFRLIEISPHLLKQSAISSTRIRQHLMAGNVEEANELLGYAYFFEGVVVEGNRLGRTIGYATANLKIGDEEKLIPGNGVYAVVIKPLHDKLTESILYKGMMNIGFRPTIDGTKQTIEVHLFDFNQNIYGETMQVHLMHYLRAEHKFNNIDALKEQLALDKLNALKVLDNR